MSDWLYSPACCAAGGCCWPDSGTAKTHAADATSDVVQSVNVRMLPLTGFRRNRRIVSSLRRGIRHSDSLQAIDQDVSGVAHERDRRRARQTFFQHANLGAIAVDRNFFDASFALCLKKRRTANRSQAVG